MLRRRNLILLLTALLLACLAAVSAMAHPGSDIVVDRRGCVYFLDTGGGVWKVDASGKLSHHGDPRFHWMAIDESKGGVAARLPAPRGGEIIAIGSDPTILVSSDVPVAVGDDGAIYYPELGTDGRLRIVRWTRAGETNTRAVLPNAALRWINGLALGPDGSLYYTEDRAVRKIDARGNVTTIADNVSVPGCQAIPGNEASTGPFLRGLAVDRDGTIFVAASGCGAVLRLSPRGTGGAILRTIAPWSPTAVAVAPSGLYVLEYLHTVVEDRRAWIPRVRKVLASGRVLDVAAVRR